MSRRTRKLQKAFDVQVSENKVRGFFGGKKDAAVEKIPAKKPKDRIAKKLRVRETGGQRCTCRKPRLDAHGKCVRCHQKP